MQNSIVYMIFFTILITCTDIQLEYENGNATQVTTIIQTHMSKVITNIIKLMLSIKNQSEFKM